MTPPKADSQTHDERSASSALRPGDSRVERLGLIGDVHCEDAILAKALAYLAPRCDKLVCTGDLADGIGSLDRCCELLARYEVATVRGNHDRWLLEDRVRHIKNANRRADLSANTISFLSALPAEVSVQTSAGAALVCHGIGQRDLAKVWPGSERMPPERSDDLDALIQQGRYRFVLNGHLHFRNMIHFAGLTLLNAGTLKRGHRPGVTLIDFAAGEAVAHSSDPSTGLSPCRSQPLDPAGARVWRDTQEFDSCWEPKLLYAEAAG